MEFHKIQVYTLNIQDFTQKKSKIGSWDLDPYTSFGISAFVELLGYIVVHLILDRIGRKIPYCCFVILFSIISFLIIPVQYLMEKNGQSLIENIFL